MLEYCCVHMKSVIETECGAHNTHECPDMVIIRTFHGFGLPIKDGGSSFIEIAYCPFCGVKLPETNPEGLE